MYWETLSKLSPTYKSDPFLVIERMRSFVFLRSLWIIQKPMKHPIRVAQLVIALGTTISNLPSSPLGRPILHLIRYTMRGMRHQLGYRMHVQAKRMIVGVSEFSFQRPVKQVFRDFVLRPIAPKKCHQERPNTLIDQVERLCSWMRNHMCSRCRLRCIRFIRFCFTCALLNKKIIDEPIVFV